MCSDENPYSAPRAIQCLRTDTDDARAVPFRRVGWWALAVGLAGTIAYAVFSFTTFDLRLAETIYALRPVAYALCAVNSVTQAIGGVALLAHRERGTHFVWLSTFGVRIGLATVGLVLLIAYVFQSYADPVEISVLVVALAGNLYVAWINRRLKQSLSEASARQDEFQHAGDDDLRG